MLSPELALELRAARPVASPELRKRVLEVAAREQLRREPRFKLPPLRRGLLIAVPAVLVLGFGFAVVHGFTHGKGKQAVVGAAIQSAGVGVRTTPGAKSAPKDFRDVVSPTRSRLQQYGASMQIQVENLDALSDATKRAMRFARLVGGYVAYVRYSSPIPDRGSAELIVRVPIDRVQDAIAEYSSLGTIRSQKVL